MTAYPMETSFFVGLDLGQSNDHSALAIVEQPFWIPSSAVAPTGELFRQYAIETAGWVSPSALTPTQQAAVAGFWDRRPGRPPLSLSHLERFPLGTPYPEIVRQVKARLSAPPLAGASWWFIVDATGVGRPVVDAFYEAELRPLAATITAGNTVNFDPAAGTVSAPKRDLVSAMAVLLESRRLKIARELPEAPTLVRELQEFKRRVTPAGHEQMASWRESVHDDLVLATALACWWREWVYRHFDDVVIQNNGYRAS